MSGQLNDVTEYHNLIKEVLLEMELGIPRDYKLKEGFIRTELDDVLGIETALNKLEESRKCVMVQLQILKQDKNSHKSPSVQDSEQLQQFITESMELLDRLEQNDRQLSSLQKRLG